MFQSIHTAVIQMDVGDAPTGDRLFRADQMVFDASEMGAELVVLPELFPTGYRFSDQNFARAEREDGPTLTWMKRTAHRMHVHLAGSLLLVDRGEIYNSMFVAAPSGETWRYDKNWPWAWERGYFRENRTAAEPRGMVAHTALGKLGMMIGWDALHQELWQQYAGKADMIVICASTPQIGCATLTVLDGANGAGHQEHIAGPLRLFQDDGEGEFMTIVREQAAWMGVPAAVSAGCGSFESDLPGGKASLLPFVPGAPKMAIHLAGAGCWRLRMPMTDTCMVISASGEVLARRPQQRAEGFASAEAHLPDIRKVPLDRQPKSRGSHSAIDLADSYLARISIPNYQKGIERIR